MQEAIAPRAADANPEVGRSRADRSAHPVARALVFALSATLALAGVGILLGIAGVFTIWLVLPVGLAVGYLIARLWTPVGEATNGRSSLAWWLAAGIALIAVVTNSFFPSEQVIGGRDGQTYLATGAWLAAEGDLFVDARQGPFADAEDLEFRGPGFYDSREDGRLNPQFLHGLPALLATGRTIGGDWLMFRVNAILGGLALLAVFAFARLLVGGWLALLVEATLAVNLVFAFYARAPFSEILAMLLIFGGLWALWSARDVGSKRAATLAGLLVGGSFLARIDTLVLLIPLVALLVYEQRRSALSPEHRAVVRGLWMGLVPVLVLGFVDLIVVSPDYLIEQRRNVLPILVLVVGVVAFDAVVGSRIGSFVRRMPAPVRDRIAWAGAAFVVALAVFAYFVRPLVQEVGGSPYFRLPLDPIERAAGEGRSFSENSARWLGWYLGPIGVFAGFLGWAWLTRRVMSGARRRALPFLGMFSTMAVLYLWRPTINPDHIWAMRRFLPVVIPGMLVMGAFLLGEIWKVSARSKRALPARLLVGVVAAGMFTGSLMVLAPRAYLHEFDGLAADLQRACEVVGDDAAILVVGDVLDRNLLQSFRSYCSIPTAYAADADPSLVRDLATGWAREGRQLWLLAKDGAILEPLGDGEIIGLLVGTYDILELTFTRRPSDLIPWSVGAFVTRAG